MRKFVKSSSKLIPSGDFSMPSSTRIMIVAGEASGDLHGAGLVRSLRSLEPRLEICGLGGRELASAGVEILFDISRLAVMGISEVFSRLLDIRAAMRTLTQRMKNQPPDLLILIDFPDFNLMLAKKAKRLGVPVFYYISPKVWAWRSGRVKKIGRLVDRMAVILPFEQEFYRQRGVAVEFVGHPLLDSVRVTMSGKDFLRKHNIAPGSTIVGILPGSRKQEIAALLPVFMETAVQLAADKKNIVFLLPLASTITLSDLESSGLADYSPDLVNVRVISGEPYDLMAGCDAVMAASGTVTLELAILNVPMVVVYRVSPLTCILGRLLIKLDYFSLVNLVAGRKVVTELLQEDVVPYRITAAVRNLLENREAAVTMRQNLREVSRRLGEPGAAGLAARMALDLIDAKKKKNGREGE